MKQFKHALTILLVVLWWLAASCPHTMDVSSFKPPVTLSVIEWPMPSDKWTCNIYIYKSKLLRTFNDGSFHMNSNGAQHIQHATVLWTKRVFNVHQCCGGSRPATGVHSRCEPSLEMSRSQPTILLLPAQWKQEAAIPAGFQQYSSKVYLWQLHALAYSVWWGRAGER